MNEMTADLQAIGADLSRAIRRDRDRHRVGSSAVRVTVLALAATIALSATALAAGTLTGVIDLGDGQTANPVSGSLGPGDPNLAYRYQVDGLPANRDGTGPVYVESAQPLQTDASGQVDASWLVATRRGCLANVKSVADATIWIFDTSCSTDRTTTTSTTTGPTETANGTPGPTAPTP